jgi:crossover junction endodeoxyribonuclease RuvC
MIACGAVTIPAANAFPEKLRIIHVELGVLLARHRPDVVAIENLFHAANARSALKLGHARGVAMLAAVEAGVPIVEYTPAEVKQSVVEYGRAEKGSQSRSAAPRLPTARAFDASSLASPSPSSPMNAG